ncbi:ABC transporter substrate-binding protein [Paenibacillus chitinolyticus]|uniref:ABC transporter substrate-binding protein n=1 Tax=Paenibacillus chitinolyticus TaxID=79263 RepID=A0A410WRM9_9BACL|nr:extracellular solute-binding protein [Paenibacillus chitinolyticus]MCY9592144.1 extracellular solute-binding protein [Paenibacillus chitinolyticus]MCY9598468.1 extracellular solute-binding protein [Paenibacillus chitinolyticus]QAV16970.1 ABC transporter substrate-binding protein [Paenibacillus chitinolyticus]
MTRKLLSTFLSLTLFATIASACAGGKQEGASSANTKPSTAAAADYGDTGGLKLPLVDEPVTLNWMLVSDNPDLSNKLIVKEIEKRTGIKLNIQAYSTANYKDKLKVVMASGKLPDVFHGLTPAEANKLGSQGALTPINPYLDKLPNFKSLYVDNKDSSWVMKSWSDDKDNLYTWPIYNINRDVNHGFLYRKDIFDKLGIQEWNTTEEFYQTLKKLKEAYPTSYPYASKTKDYIFRDWAPGWGIGGASYPAAYDENTKMWKLAFIQPEYKQMLDFMKKLYNEGLLDPEFITDTEASWTAKMTTNNKSFVTFDWIGRLDLFHNQVKSQNPDYNLRYGNPVGPTGKIKQLSKIDNFGIVVSNNKNKEVALKLLDYLSSPSGAALVTMGVEGETFKMEGGKAVYPELKDVPNVDIGVLKDRYGLWLEGMYVRADSRSVYYNFTEKEQEAQDKMVKNNKIDVLDPVLKFTDPETKKIADVLTSLQKSANEFSTKYILSKSYGDAQWNEWLQTAEKMGASAYIEAYNNAQKRFDSK